MPTPNIPTTMATTITTPSSEPTPENEVTTPTSPSDPLTVMLNGSGPQRAGENYTLTCTASGGGNGAPTYQWRRDGTLLTTQSPPDRLSFFPLRQADSGEYTCTVTRGTMNVTSNSVTITVGGNILTLNHSE